jgi:tRNA threonylcarbamoyladenosine biosynthesis protein TsaE
MTAVTTDSPEETIRLAERVARELVAGDVLALSGELGSGKTVFTKGIASGLGVARPREVTSPTYVIMVEYEREGVVALRHFDAYRVTSAEEFLALDGGELVDPRAGAVSVVEWSDRVGGALPERRIDVSFEVTGETSRRITVRPRGGREAVELGLEEVVP